MHIQCICSSSGVVVVQVWFSSGCALSRVHICDEVCNWFRCGSRCSELVLCNIYIYIYIRLNTISSRSCWALHYCCVICCSLLIPARAFWSLRSQVSGFVFREPPKRKGLSSECSRFYLSRRSPDDKLPTACEAPKPISNHNIQNQYGGCDYPPSRPATTFGLALDHTC